MITTKDARDCTKNFLWKSLDCIKNFLLSCTVQLYRTVHMPGNPRQFSTCVVYTKYNILDSL